MVTSTPYTDANKKYGSVRKAAKAMNVARSTFFDNMNRERRKIESIRFADDASNISVRGKSVRRFIFTCAVRGAPVHQDFMNNLIAYAKHLGADLKIGPLTNKGSRQRYSDYEEGEFDPAVVEYITETAMIIGDKIRFSPELQLTPTMVKPLQGLQTYTKKMWGIFPHTKISAETVATHKDRLAKWITTTGAVTHPYYSPTKAGYRAHFDHMHGALIVEVSRDGVWFRHLTPTNELDGTFYDLNVKVAKSKVTDNKDGVQAIVYGDIHAEVLDSQVALATWGYRCHDCPPARKGGKTSFVSVAEHLSPATQVFHDLMDMRAANYHELDNIFKRYHRWIRGKNVVARDFDVAMDFLRYVSRFGDENVVVDSNHEYFIEKWLMQFDPAEKEDFDNIDLYYRFKLKLLQAIRKDEDYSLLEILLQESVVNSDHADEDSRLLDLVRFLRCDESYEIHNIECGWHGHRGANGRRGSRAAFKYVTEKSIIAHVHAPGIESGCTVVGTSTKNDLGYNSGPSSWAASHAIIYPHGGRTLITMNNGKFWADQGDVT